MLRHLRLPVRVFVALQTRVIVSVRNTEETLCAMTSTIMKSVTTTAVTAANVRLLHDSLRLKAITSKRTINKMAKQRPYLSWKTIAMRA